MTQQQALQEARRRWGVNASVRYFPESGHPCSRYRVDGGPLTYAYFGHSWEAAFADADPREREK